MLSQKKLGKGYKLEFWKAGLTIPRETGHLTVSKAVLCSDTKYVRKDTWFWRENIDQ
jgi:hypothetical protein